MRAFAIAVVIGLMCISNIAQADVFNMGEGLTNLEMVTVGDPGNTGELTRDGVTGVPPRLCGDVNYTYKIGKFEITTAQYTDFLNHKAKSDPYGLYDAKMTIGAQNTTGCNIQRSGSGTFVDPYTYSVALDWANRPVNNVSYWDSLRFINWLSNGQGDGDTETGSYTLDGYNGVDGRTIKRNPGATWVMPSEDEWYKAAYYKGGNNNAGYWFFPTQSNSIPSNDLTNPDAGNNANCAINHTDYTIGGPYFRTNAGEFENSESTYGTYDQGGNVAEWNEEIRIYATYNTSTKAYDYYAKRIMRGSGFNSSDLNTDSLTFHFSAPSEYYADLGFRVAYVPEPSSLIALVGGLISLLGIRRRKV